jgi:hypothetical protein
MTKYLLRFVFFGCCDCLNISKREIKFEYDEHAVSDSRQEMVHRFLKTRPSSDKGHTYEWGGRSSVNFDKADYIAKAFTLANRHSYF